MIFQEYFGIFFIFSYKKEGMRLVSASPTKTFNVSKTVLLILLVLILVVVLLILVVVLLILIVVLLVLALLILLVLLLIVVLHGKKSPFLRRRVK